MYLVFVPLIVYCTLLCVFAVNYKQIENGLKEVNKLISESYKKRPSVGLKMEFLEIKPRLVAVSKTKSKELIIAAYNGGQRHFGENYVQELVQKSMDLQYDKECKDIKWHFIGNMQRNKVNKIASVPNLFMVETVDSEKLATALNNAWGNIGDPMRLKIMIQINTSGEKAKNGAAPSEATKLALHVKNECPNLELKGLMTIGRFDHDLSTGPNPDFLTLIECRKEVSKVLNVDDLQLELSMGMSGDFEHAIEMGSTNVRVGSLIFGEREYNKPVTPEAVDQATGNMSGLKMS